MCLIFKKKKFKIYKKIRKSVTFINIQTYESDTRHSLIHIRLSVTIKEYKEVPLSQRNAALTPQDIYTIPKTRCLEERQRKVLLFSH